METTEINFLDELLKEEELKEQKQSEAYCDLILMQIAELNQKIEYISAVAQKEINIIQNWLYNKSEAIQKRISYLESYLEQFMKTNNLKTIDLPHGILKMRKSPDRVEITDIDVFLRNAKNDFIRIIPEEIKPDLNKIKAFIKKTGVIPEGVTFIEGEEQFTYKLKTNNKETSYEPKA